MSSHSAVRHSREVQSIMDKPPVSLTIASTFVMTVTLICLLFLRAAFTWEKNKSFPVQIMTADKKHVRFQSSLSKTEAALIESGPNIKLRLLKTKAEQGIVIQMIRKSKGSPGIYVIDASLQGNRYTHPEITPGQPFIMIINDEKGASWYNFLIRN